MSDDVKCTRCGDAIPPLLGPPPDDRDVWTRNGVLMTATVAHHVMRLRMFTRRWLPERAADQLTETYTTLDLCDWCAGDVFLFAQGEPPRVRPGAMTTEGEHR
jgi:hypothetical protein